jgi:biopolymer transport protein TolR
MSEINVTPMVDVMLVLLIMFMVTAPLLQQGVKVELPKAQAKTLDASQEFLVLTVTRDRKIYIGPTEVAYESLRDQLSANPRLRQEKEMYLHADQGLPYGTVVDIMAIMKDAGVDKLGMVTDPVAQRP